ncbi:MAG: glycosyltransferase family 2 protein [Candidatus Komeilibacteria bacterium]|jgi:glycosyltransferase involved in cell wall biosynthesis|nr:glycosyltransferase family 2 protein [Candidatus Komeilibacteria bacterium]MBT4447462.1 glycosyltransferase family 2 protein [Candidatus Komeilibacteria bacterium]
MDLSVVIPLYNEEESLRPLNKILKNVLGKLNVKYEILYIDDGSRDESVKILKEISSNDKHVKVIELKRNFGKSIALAVGFDKLVGDLVITMDADLQDDPEEIPKLIEQIEKNYDLVSGWKYKRKDPLVKILSSKIFNFTVSLLSGLKIHDFNCGFKIYRKEVVKSIELYGELHRFLPFLAYQQGFKVGEIKVKHNVRQFGESKYGRSGLKRLSNYILDPINVVFLTKYQRKPAHFFGNIGLISFAIGLLISIYLTVIWFMGQGIGNRPLLFLGVLLMIIGIQLVSMGFLGELIVRENISKSKDKYVKKHDKELVE